MSVIVQFLPVWIFYVLLFTGVIGTVLIMVIGGLIPIQYRSAVQILSAFCLAFGAFFIGGITNEEKWQLEVIKQQAEIARLQEQSAKVTTKIVTEYLEKKIYIKEKGREIIKQVPVYITEKADSNCIITDGFVRLHNSAAKNEVPDTSGVTYDSSTKVKLSEVGTTVADNYNKYHQVEEQLISLQDWIIEQGKVYNAE